MSLPSTSFWRLNMDKTEAFVEAIYKTVEETHESVVKNLSADSKFSARSQIAFGSI